MKNLKEIIEEFGNEVEFPVLGGTLIISKERNIYNQIRIKYNALADKAVVKFKELLPQLKSVQEILDSVSKLFLTSVQESLNELSRDAISVGCYSLDMEAVTKLCMKKGYFDSYDKAYEAYKKQYLSILIDFLDKAAKISGNVDNRPRLEVATLGGSTLDAVANQLQADFTNAVAGELYSGYATLQINEEIDETEKQIDMLFKNQDYRNKLINSVWSCVANLRLVITGYLNDEAKLSLGGWVTNDDSKKAESIYNNLMQFDLPQEQQQEFVLSILQLNPYVYNYYSGLLAKYLDNAKDFLNIAEFFNINIKNSIKSILRDYAVKNLGTTFDDVKACRELVNNRISELELPADSNELAEDSIQNHSAVLINKYMIENMGETREDLFRCLDKVLEIQNDISFDEKYTAIAYEAFSEKLDILDAELIKQLTKWIDENIGTTEDDAHKCREELEKQVTEQELHPEKAAPLYQIVDDRLKKLDEEYRTVEGFTFPTRESADETKAIIEQHKDTLYKAPSEFIYRSDYTEQIEKIKEIPLIDKLIVHFSGVYERRLKEFDKKCKNAKLHDDKLKGQKKSLKSLARSMFVSDDKQKQDWEEVTRNGQYPLNEVMGTSENEGNSAGGGLRGLFGKK